MGASGAGKTTLLNAVAGEAAGGSLSGHILVNGTSVDSDLMRKLSVFVFQDDIILATMTVREVVRMSAILRLPSEVCQFKLPPFPSVTAFPVTLPCSLASFHLLRLFPPAPDMRRFQDTKIYFLVRERVQNAGCAMVRCLQGKPSRGLLDAMSAKSSTARGVF